MRQEMRQLLTPRMIQSMEILQLPLMALEERIDQEMEVNPVLELTQDSEETTDLDLDAPPPPPEPDENSADQKSLVIKEESNQADDFARLDRMGDYLENEEFATNERDYRGQSGNDGDRDKKLDAMNNTAARSITLTEHLLDQWTFIEANDAVKQAGKAIIKAIDSEGYFRVELEQIQQDSRAILNLNDLREALKLVQTLEPAGVGARNLQECLLLQLGRH